ncbi:MAG TPA: HAD-IC family P-type ATPase [Patescibacteria group bacterium]|nr:HAD-IC family P-type ATPase [Patescibacteria group bacterium]
MLKGLSEKEVLFSRKKHGINVLPENNSFLAINILISQFKSPLIYIILVTAAISLLLKEYTDAALMLVLIAFNCTMGFIQEYKAQKTLIALRNILHPIATVIRDGVSKKISISEIVIGDAVILNSGDKIPADGKLVSSTNLVVNEAILTGESEGVAKSSRNKKSRLFMGTNVIAGHGIMLVKEIGSSTEMGKIGQSMLSIKEEKTLLQEKIEDFSKNLTILVVLTSLLIFFIGILNDQNIWDMVRISIILAIAAIPEGLPIAITIILALGMKRVLKKNGLVKKLLSIETLGTTSVICTDKTGTLTEGNMRIVKLKFKEKNRFLTALSIVNEEKNNVEIAIGKYLEKIGFDATRFYKTKKLVYEEPFDSEKKHKVMMVRTNTHNTSYIMGAPEIIIEMCKISEKEKRKTLKIMKVWAAKGLRIVGVISKEKGNLRTKKDYKWLGLLAIEDPIRAETRETIRTARRSGIDVKIITGDYLPTAISIARQLGFRITDKNAIQGEDIEKMTDTMLAKKIGSIALMARITPHQKLRIVEALQTNGEVVAMAGDGVNDALALKKADIGIVVGDATETAKESADLVLLDNNFKTIISACEQGRLVFANIKKVVAYVLSNSFVEIFLIFGAILMKLPAPLTIVQILWVHLICDGPLDIVLGFEGRRKSLESEDPRKLKREAILPNSMKAMIFIVSFTIGILSLVVFNYYYGHTGDIHLAQTLAFSIVASVDIIYIFSFKDLSKPIYKIEKFFKNRYLIWAAILGAATLFAGIYVPYFNKVLGTEPLPAIDWLIPLAVALVSILWIELIKYVTYHKLRKG